jgi:hypothetical protein
MRVRLDVATCVAIAALTIIVSPLSAQTAQELAVQTIVEDLTQWDAVLAAQGFERFGDPLTGGAAAGESDEHSVRLEGGSTYRIVAACDQDCTDVDLFVLDAAGNTVASDIEEDNDPIVSVQPSSSATYTVRVAIVNCSAAPCLHTAALYRDTGEAAQSQTQGGAASTGRVVDERGRLAKGDVTIESGEFVDGYEVEVTAGQTLVADLVSTDFDSYLYVRGPNGEQEDNDDYESDSSRSHLEVPITASGTWRVVATSYQSGETGDYRLTVDLQGAGAVSAVAQTGSSSGIQVGALRDGDTTLDSGEFFDSYPLQGSAGQEVVIDLRSDDVDPYLILIAPNEETEQNDDFEGSAQRSVIATTLDQDGEYTVVVTTYAPEESGAYTLNISQGGGDAGVRSETGALASGDETIDSGEFADVFRIQGTPGQELVATVSSTDFDTYLMVVGPGDDRSENDDLEGRPGVSEVQMTLGEAGEYRVVVTSYEAGETGSYALTIDQQATVRTVQQGRDVTELTVGSRSSGSLAEGDTKLSSGEFRDMFVFEGVAGQSVSVAMRSQGFDSYVGIITPAGEQIDNDDWEGDQTTSRVDHILAETGRYRVMATSYQAGESGSYEIEVTPGASGAATVATSALGPAQVYGVFVGVSDYGGRANDLAFTADDAVSVSNALQTSGAMRAENAIVLTDARATRAAVEQAVREIGARAGPDDMFVFFYSGHGAQVPRDGPQPSDPDALDETLEFYDTRITDDEFSALLSEISPGIALIALDACFSGGFSKDVVSVPGRMGLFSSEEDVVSSVAQKFRAGGYLAHFIADGVGRQLADLNGDGTTSALELSQYLHNRYRADVESSSGNDYVRTGGPQLGYQHLVVDRGSIGSSEVLFRQ